MPGSIRESGTASILTRSSRGERPLTRGAVVAGTLGRVGRALLRFGRYKPLGAASGLVVFVIVLAALFAPWVATHDPLKMSVSERFQGYSSRHLMGTDNWGRDVFSNVVHGARISVSVGFLAVFLGTGLGALWGLVSGYAGGWFDLLTQRLVDMLQGLPTLVLALVLVAALGASVTNTVLAIAFTLLPLGARVVRATAISVKENTYVDAARAIGASPLRVALRHVCPQCMAPYLIVVSTTLGTAILMEASLSFLGVGVPPPEPSWGRMLSGVGRDFLLRAPWISFFPGLAISLTVLGFNLLGDALRDVWDPRLRGTGPAVGGLGGVGSRSAFRPARQ